MATTHPSPESSQDSLHAASTSEQPGDHTRDQVNAPISSLSLNNSPIQGASNSATIGSASSSAPTAASASSSPSPGHFDSFAIFSLSPPMMQSNLPQPTTYNDPQGSFEDNRDDANATGTGTGTHRPEDHDRDSLSEGYFSASASASSSRSSTHSTSFSSPRSTFDFGAAGTSFNTDITVPSPGTSLDTNPKAIITTLDIGNDSTNVVISSLRDKGKQRASDVIGFPSASSSASSSSSAAAAAAASLPASEASEDASHVNHQLTGNEVDEEEELDEEEAPQLPPLQFQYEDERPQVQASYSYSYAPSLTRYQYRGWFTDVDASGSFGAGPSSSNQKGKDREYDVEDERESLIGDVAGAMEGGLCMGSVTADDEFDEDLDVARAEAEAEAEAPIRREIELDSNSVSSLSLHDTMGDAHTGAGVTGEPGAGKSALSIAMAFANQRAQMSATRDRDSVISTSNIPLPSTTAGASASGTSTPARLRGSNISVTSHSRSPSRSRLTSHSSVNDDAYPSQSPSPSRSTSTSRLQPMRSVSLKLKLSLKRSRDFLRSKASPSSSSSSSSPSRLRPPQQEEDAEEEDDLEDDGPSSRGTSRRGSRLPSTVVSRAPSNLSLRAPEEPSTSASASASKGLSSRLKRALPTRAFSSPGAFASSSSSSSPSSASALVVKLRSSAIPPILTTRIRGGTLSESRDKAKRKVIPRDDGADEDGRTPDPQLEGSEVDTNAELPTTALLEALDKGKLKEPPKDLFDTILPVEVRLQVFASLARSYVEDLRGLVERGEWTVARAGRTESRWVGWEGGVRELVKLSRVSKTWQSLVFDGQLWSTLGGSSAFPPSLLSRISRVAGPFVQSLQLEGAADLTAQDLMNITANIATVQDSSSSGTNSNTSSVPSSVYSSDRDVAEGESKIKWTHSDSTSSHQRSMSLPSSVPIDHWSTNVTSINLSGAYGITTRSLHRLLASCALLQKVNLRGLAAVTNTTCIVIGEGCKEIEVLDLSRCAGVDAFGITFICEAVENQWKDFIATGAPRTIRNEKGEDEQVVKSKLKELRISGLRRASFATVGQIASAFPELEVLDLSYAVSLTDEAWAGFVEWHDEEDGGDDGEGQYPSLSRSLSSGSSYAPGSGSAPGNLMRSKPSTRSKAPRIPYVELTSRQAGFDPTDRTIHRRRLTKLRHLNLSSCTSLTDLTCTYLAHAVPRLEFLELGGIGAELRDTGVLHLLETTPRLRKLDLSDAANIADAVLGALTPPPPPPPQAELAARRAATLPVVPPASRPINIPGRLGFGLGRTSAVAPPAPSRVMSTPLSLINAPPPPPKTGQFLEHLVVSYATLLTPEAFLGLIEGCPKLVTLEADNTGINDAVVQKFVELQRVRLAESSKSREPSHAPVATLVAIDCANVGRVMIDDLASKGHTRPRAGYRSWDARLWAPPYADALDGDDQGSALWNGGGLDECDEQKVIVKSFRSWQVVDKWQLEREKRKKTAAAAAAASSATGGHGAGNGGGDGSPTTPSSRGSRWFVRRSSGTGTAAGSGAATPRSIDEDDRGCTIM